MKRKLFKTQNKEETRQIERASKNVPKVNKNHGKEK